MENKIAVLGDSLNIKIVRRLSDILQSNGYTICDEDESVREANDIIVIGSAAVVANKLSSFNAVEMEDVRFLGIRVNGLGTNYKPIANTYPTALLKKVTNNRKAITNALLDYLDKRSGVRQPTVSPPCETQ